MRFHSDAQRRAVFAKIYPSWMRTDLSDIQKDNILRYKNRLDASGIKYQIIEDELVPDRKLIREIAKDDGEYMFDRTMKEIVPREVIPLPKKPDKKTRQTTLDEEENDFALFRKLSGRHVRRVRPEEEEEETQFAKLDFKDGFVSLVPVSKIKEPILSVYDESATKRWLAKVGDESVPPLILKPSYMDPGRFTVWDGRHRLKVLKMQGADKAPSRIYDEGKLIYPKRFERRKFEGDETHIEKLGEEYRYLI